ncbi:WPP domain-interacting protein 2-like [Gastrolobium bilobum]|uniref:WPP domain-interacting protein 2-like n=1 Tax=Gastrolobium bilobum TaxID=150636 RepID=UPI002AB0716B|nr:WPP domain-interacting protein 2-like [Gastrolobium bilobum]
MDLGSKCSSSLESEGDNDGSFANENFELSPYQKGRDSEEPVHPIGASEGCGLKKWKRIRRDMVKDLSLCVDSENLANSAQWVVQQGKGQVESTKKHRSDRVRKKKENSHSSIESDSRNSNFEDGIFAVTSNGEYSGRQNNSDDGNSDEEHTYEHFSEDFQASCSYNNMGEDEDLLQEKSEQNQSSTVEDPLIESIRSLQAAQEALEEEIKKFGVIANKPFSIDDDSTKCSSATADVSAVDLGFHKSCLSAQPAVEEIKQIASSSLELKVLSLTKNINILESKSKELQDMIAIKDSKIAELETALSDGKFPKEEYACTIGLSEEKFEEVESELLSLFRQKIEAEIEYLVVTKMMQNLKVTSAFVLLETQETLSGQSGNQVHVSNKLGEAHGKESKLKNRADELEKYGGDILGIEETFMMQKRVCKLTLCLFLQLTLLFMVVWLFVSKLLPNSGVIVPT